MIVLRVFCGPVMTSLEMAGITINILKAAEEYIQYIGRILKNGSCLHCL